MNLLQTLASEILSEHGYLVMIDEEQGGRLKSRVSLPTGQIRFTFGTVESPQSYGIFFHAPEPVPEKHRFKVMEYLTRINYLIPMGHFEINLDDGHVRFGHAQYKTCESLESDELLTLMRVGLDRMETFLPGMLRIIYGGIHPVAALAEIESQTGYEPIHAGRYQSHRIN